MIKIAGIQMACSEDKDENVQKALRMGQLAAKKGARIICFQELFNTHWFPRDINESAFLLAEDIDGPTLATMRALAKGKEVALICPFFERDGEQYFNTTAVIDQQGEIMGTYRKVHIPQIPLWEERAYFSPGDKGFPVFDLGLAKIGIQICWDNFFPEGTSPVLPGRRTQQGNRRSALGALRISLTSSSFPCMGFPYRQRKWDTRA